MNILIKTAWVTFILATFLTSCKEEELTLDTRIPIEENIITYDIETPQIKLSKKLENPYSLSNMMIAWDSLSNRLGVDKDKVKATHYYVKFIPIDEGNLVYSKVIQL
jgi:hypothetical protein